MDNELECVQEFKYLGVTLDPLLSWTSHINKINCKVSQKIGIIRRVKCLLPAATLIMLGNALILPYFDYYSNVWTNSKKNNSSSLQIQQNKLARILLSADYLTPTDDMLNELNWFRLNKRWDIAMYCFVYKCINHYAPNYLTSNFIYTSSIHSYPTRHQCSASLVIPKYNTSSGLRTFQYRAVKLWNSLPADLRINVSSMSMNIFKH